ncbi:MAG: adenosylcobinamide-phosphate synthase CbiB [Methylomonas sp.]|jgi:adenosylcobinamide-phosphate synthase
MPLTGLLTDYSTSVSLVMAVALDRWLGEPDNRFHPLAFYGRYAGFLEGRFLQMRHTPRRQRYNGVIAWMLALLPALLWLLWPPLAPPAQLAFAGLSLYFCIAAQSLRQHARAVRIAMLTEDLPEARRRVAYIVSRQTERMSAADIRRAAIESVLENGADAVFAPLFWFVCLGPFAAVLYRLSNTLDAMWGYKNQRYRHFGWASARFDDVLNFIPARLTALSYALLGFTRRAFYAWKRHAPLLESPNAGAVMSAGAGALNLQLGGPAWYHGRRKNKPWFGGNNVPDNADIDLACRLVDQTLCLWVLMVIVGETFA